MTRERGVRLQGSSERGTDSDVNKYTIGEKLKHMRRSVGVVTTTHA